MALLFIVFILALIFVAVKYAISIVVYVGVALLLVAIFKRIYEYIRGY